MQLIAGNDTKTKGVKLLCVIDNLPYNLILVSENFLVHWVEGQGNNVKTFRHTDPAPPSPPPTFVWEKGLVFRTKRPPHIMQRGRGRGAPAGVRKKEPHIM
jgi:hypothetical protein